MRVVPASEGQEEQRVGLQYSLENRQNYKGVPPLTLDRVRDGLQRAVDRGDAESLQGKKQRGKAKDELRKALAVSITEYPPMLLEHAMFATKFDPSLKPAEVLKAPDTLDALLRSLEEARKVVQDITSSSSAKGYIIAKRKGRQDESTTVETTRADLLYDDFHPFRPKQFENDASLAFLEFEGFNKTVDEFFSSIEGQKLESRLEERELHAKRRLEAAKNEHTKRLGGLQAEQEINEQNAAAITANVERVQEAMDAVNGLIAQGMDWVEIGRLIELEQKRNNPVAQVIGLPLKLHENTITLLLNEEDFGENDSAYATDTDDSESESESIANQVSSSKKRMAIDMNLGMSPWANARQFYDQKRSATKKEQRTLQASAIALKSTEQKITKDLKKGLKQEKAILRPVRKQMWFEKFIWFVSSDGYLVLAGKDAQQNEIIYKRYLKKGDVYVHADLHGAATVIIRNDPRTPNAPIPPSTLSQAGTMAMASSTAWDSKAGMSAWWVNADQVSKSAPTGEFLPTGSFMVRGQKIFLPPAQLLLGFGIMFHVSDESKLRHVKHRLQGSEHVDSTSADMTTIPTIISDEQKPTDPPDQAMPEEQLEEHEPKYDDELEDEVQHPGDDPFEREAHVDDHSSNDEDAPHDMHQMHANPLQPDAEAGSLEADDIPTDNMADLALESELRSNGSGAATDDESDHSAGEGLKASHQVSKKGPAPMKRGKRGKAKKIAQKYKDQDEEDRIAAQQLIGSTVGAERAAEEAAAKAKREAELAFHKERRRAQHARTQKETAEHEEVRKLMLEEGTETLGPEEEEKMTAFDALVGTPLPGDEILDAVPVCAPWTAMAKFKYKAKFQPGATKKGKAVREVLSRWAAEGAVKGKVDEKSTDTERMWPREVDLLRALKPEETTNTVPVSKVRVMMAGGSAGQGSANRQSKGGSRGGKGSKKNR